MNGSSVLFFVALASIATGDLIAVRKELSALNGSNYRELMCESEDDDGALVWNYNLDTIPPPPTPLPHFRFDDPPFDDFLDCPLHLKDPCNDLWNGTSAWSFTDSLSRPMEPVLDRRWEDLPVIRSNSTRQYVAPIYGDGGFAFSVRASKNVEVYLRETDHTQEEFYHRIIIGDKGPSISGFPIFCTPRTSLNCSVAVERYLPNMISPTEWRTFVIMDNNQEITLLSKAGKRILFLPHIRISESSRRDIFVESTAPALFRLHNYQLLVTTKQSPLISPEMNLKGTNFCVEMAIGLCRKCQMQVVLIDARNERNKKTGGTIKPPMLDTDHEFPIWQYVRVEYTGLHNFAPAVKLKLIPELQEPNVSDRTWALGSIRKCPPIGAKRRISGIRSYKKTDSSWRNETCQKLFFDGGVVVNAMLEPTSNLKFGNVSLSKVAFTRSQLEAIAGNNLNCPEGNVGFNCSIKCESSCEGVAICNSMGCACSQGFTGTNCTIPIKELLDPEKLRVRNILVLQFNEKVIVTWDPPLHYEAVIRHYEVILEDNTSRVDVSYRWVQAYLGCEALNLRYSKPEPKNEFTTTTADITFQYMRPYARYTAKIAVHAFNRGTEEQVEIVTKPTEVPTEVFSNLRIEGYTLMWDAPKDCATISGTIYANIIVTGTSKGVEDVVIRKQTPNYSIDLSSELYGGEKYEARVYTIRKPQGKFNESIYVKIEFTAPPKAPPPVRDLEIYETDWKTMEVQLRWLPPDPPTNGEIQHYIVSSCYSSCKVNSMLRIQPTVHCKLWDKYICATVKQLDPAAESIAVSAVNVNTSMPGEMTSVSFTWNETHAKPSRPETFVAEALEKGVVNLTWSHPWKTNSRVARFKINARVTSTRLKEKFRVLENEASHDYPVNDYQLYYNAKLYLLPASTYTIYVQAVTTTGNFSDEIEAEVRTPLAIAFEKELTMEGCNEDSTILLYIPTVLNDTVNSVMSVIVKGVAPSCANPAKLDSDVREKAGFGHSETAWRAASFPTDQFAGKVFTIGDKKSYGNASTCPLKPAEVYVIAVTLLAEERSINGEIMLAKATPIRIGEPAERRTGYESWLILVIAILVVGIVIGFYLYRRRMRRRLDRIVQQEVVFSVCNDENIEVKAISSSSEQTLAATPTLSHKDVLSAESASRDYMAMFAYDVSQRVEEISLVKVKDFEDYARQAVNTGLLDRQYNSLPRGQTKPWDCGKLPQNKQKNRYGNLIAYDENRVVLEKLPEDPNSDYINANYIKGYKKERFYIATQGPKSNTVIDFWRMIWQEESSLICMIVNLTEGRKTKCEQYWPDIEKKKVYGDITVFNERHKVFTYFTFRTLRVTRRNETRTIEHLHYTAWPDHGVPFFTHSVAMYLKKLLTTPPGKGPVVVHCSTGVGRTGTIILCDRCLRRAAAEGVIDVFSEAKSIRSQRVNMVSNKDQYLLAHLTLMECLIPVPSPVPCNETLPAKIQQLKKQLPIQRDSLEKMSRQDEAFRAPIGQVSLSERNRAKHRFPELISARASRVWLKKYPATDEDSDYISAVYVDGVREQNRYVATQLPLPETFTDFWRMLAEYKVELVVALQPPDLTDKTCWPIVPSEEFKPVPYINIRTQESTEFACYTSQKLILVDSSEKPVAEQRITILSCTEWKAGRDKDPPEAESVLRLWQAAEKISRGDGPIVVLCHDGVTGCGLYLALSFLSEWMSMENECDVCLAIRAIRKSSPDFVNSLKQMEYLYDAAVAYMRCFKTHANFA